MRDINFILKSALNTLNAELSLVNRIAEKSNKLEQSMSESDWKKAKNTFVQIILNLIFASST